MIKLFRRIRQKLLSENKFSKYLIYAIGEIILVVLGILIALQINNWKTYQNERQVEYSYLKSLKEELALNKEISQAQIIFCEFQRENALTVLKVISQDYNDNNTISALVAIEHIGFQNSANFHENVWQELESTGNLRLIQNNVLKTDFSNLIREMKILKGFCKLPLTRTA